MRSGGMRARAVQRAVSRLALAAMLSVVPPALTAESPPKPRPVRERFDSLWPRPEQVRWAATTLEERVAFERLIPLLLRAAPHQKKLPERSVELAASAGFTLEVWSVSDDTFWVLRESKEHLRGAGAYVVRTGEATDDFLQAPHAYFDLGTGEIASALFLEAPKGKKPRLFATNTAHRFRGRPGETREDPEHPADVAHNADHLFNLVTDVAARLLPSLRVIQLHGFARTEVPQRKGVAAVLSTGTERTPTWLRAVAGKLTPAIGPEVHLFPEQTRILGGTHNAQARLLQAYPHARFLHLEMSAPLRKTLSDPGQLRRFCEALFDSGQE